MIRGDNHQESDFITYVQALTPYFAQNTSYRYRLGDIGKKLDTTTEDAEIEMVCLIRIG